MNIIILGGGTAGWCAAAYLSAKRPQHSYTVIESSKIGTIGVGEAATGMLTGLLDQLGIDRWEAMHKTDALPKLAIKFENWRKEPGSYLHPIDSSYSSTNDIDYMVYHSVATGTSLDQTSRLSSLISIGATNVAFDTDQNELFQVGSLTLVVDPKKLADLLREHCLKHGVKIIDAEVTDIITDNGLVTSLVTEHVTIDGDLFIDCSGSARILSQKLDAEWIDYEQYLPVNRGMPFLLENDTDERQPYITSRALKHGWMWEAPTRHRIGRGYVYSDKFCTEQEAIAELEEVFGQKIKVVKNLKFETGVLKNHFVGNVLTVGMGAGFLEPLQATSIHATLVQLNDWVNLCLGANVESTIDPVVKDNYNARCSRLYKDMMEFVAIHYVTDRDDTPFWKFVSTELKRPPKVNEIVELAKVRLLRNDDFDIYLGAAGAPLWIYSMAGLGLFDPELCASTLKEYGYNFEHIDNEKQGRFYDILSHQDSMMSQTELNQWFKYNQLATYAHPNIQQIK